MVALRKEVSKQPSIGCLPLCTLLKSLLLNCSNRKEKYQMYGSVVKRAWRSEMELNPVFKDIKYIKDKIPHS